MSTPPTLAGKAPKAIPCAWYITVLPLSLTPPGQRYKAPLMSKAYTPPPVAPSPALEAAPATPEKAPLPERSGERIAKLLARAGIASRREVERIIAEGRVALDGVVIETPATVLESLRGITVDGQPVKAAEATRLFAFHKPDGLITAERDPAGRPTIYTALRNALPPGTPRVMPVGRLDFNTEGLLLLTNDGELKRKLELPSTRIPRTYRARTFGPITQAQLEELAEGIEIDGMRYGSVIANMERSAGHNRWIEVTITEGKNREVRRVLEHLGLEVSRLMRTSYGPIPLADLPRGAAVEIRPADVERFVKALNAGTPLPGPGSYRAVAAPVAPPKAVVPPRDAAARRARGPAPARDPADTEARNLIRAERAARAPRTTRTARTDSRDGKDHSLLGRNEAASARRYNSDPRSGPGTEPRKPGAYPRQDRNGADDSRAPRGDRRAAPAGERRPAPYGSESAPARRGPTRNAGPNSEVRAAPRGDSRPAYGDRNRPASDRPAGDRPSKPYADRPASDRPTTSKPYGDRSKPAKPYNDRSNPSRPNNDRPKPRGPRK